MLVSAPPFASPDAERPAAEVVPTLVRGPLRKLRRDGDRLGRSPDDAALHRVRILAKRVRYATDVAAPLAGKRAHGAAHALAQLQDVLGEHNDACVALTRLRALAQDATPAAVSASGLLGVLQIARAADCRGQVPHRLQGCPREKPLEMDSLTTAVGGEDARSGRPETSSAGVIYRPI